ncbi:hypothetical protein AN958_04929 [Leucoagaricus sp. SymC.cos]|nr:hypothetical protein AN958_04929 [Leucoagaricus sp. SymC.cos]
MLRRAATYPRHYLEHSAAILSCKTSTRHLPSAQLRWGTVAATSPQYSPVQQAPRHEDAHVEKSSTSTRSRPLEVSTRHLTSSELDSPEHLANAFTSFLKHCGEATETVLSSGSPIFSPIHEILQKPRNVRRVANHLAASTNPASCIRLLNLSVAYGRPPNAPIYEGVCWTLSKHKQYALVLETCRLAKESLGLLSGRLLGWRLKAICQLENFASVGTILRDYEEAGVKPSRRTWHLILIAHLRNRNLFAARQCLKLMEEAGFPVDPTTHAVIATNYRHLGQDSQVRELALVALDSLPPATGALVVNQLLETHLHLDDELGFQQLLSLFDRGAIEPLRVLLNPLVNSEDLTVPLPALASPVTVSPNANTFLIAIRFCIARSAFLTAEKIFYLIGQQNYDLSSTILTAYLELQFAAGRPVFAVSIASRLFAPGMLDGLFGEFKMDQPEAHWRWPFTSSKVPPTIDVLNALLRGLLNARGLVAARIMLELMRRVDVEPNSYTMKIITNYLIRSENTAPSAVLRILRQLSLVFRPSLHHMHSIMSRLLLNEKRRLYSSKHRISRVQAWAAHYNSAQDVDRDLSFPAAGLKLEHSLSRPNLARSLLQSLETRNVQSDSTVLRLRMSYEGIIRRDVTAVVDTYNDMLARGMSPTLYHVAALMEAFTRRGETDMALKIMCSVKLKPNLVMYTILLHGYAYQGQPKAAAQLLQVMIANGIHPDAKAIYAVCNGFVLARQLATARKFLVTLWSYVEPFPERYARLPLLDLLRIFRTLDDSSSVSKRKISLKRRLQLRKDLVDMVKHYRRAAGLPDTLVSNPLDGSLAKKAMHVNRKE